MKIESTRALNSHGYFTHEFLGRHFAFPSQFAIPPHPYRYQVFFNENLYLSRVYIWIVSTIHGTIEDFFNTFIIPLFIKIIFITKSTLETHVKK